MLIDGYQGSTELAPTIPADTRAAYDQAGQWIIQLYRAWGKPDRASEWTAKLESTKTSQK